MTRDEHLAWCKERALSELEGGENEAKAIGQAMTSMFSDLGKHPETADHSGITVIAMELFAGFISTREQARNRIEGFR